jgi:hypothetical protein
LMQLGCYRRPAGQPPREVGHPLFIRSTRASGNICQLYDNRQNRLNRHNSSVLSILSVSSIVRRAQGRFKCRSTYGILMAAIAASVTGARSVRPKTRAVGNLRSRRFAQVMSAIPPTVVGHGRVPMDPRSKNLIQPELHAAVSACYRIGQCTISYDETTDRK